jgi:hypothetical protein
MNIPLVDITFSLNPKNDLCCLEVPSAWYESKVTRIGQGDDAVELLIGVEEVGTVVECPHCGSKFLLNEQGVFEWVDPDEFELVDADEPVLATA